MSGINIFFAGPDATKKTTLALRLRDYLIDSRRFKAEMISFPSPVSFGTQAIYAHKQERTKMGPHALSMAYAFDRIDYTEAYLLPIRQKNPDTIFIFDRGSLDGRIYAATRTPDGFTKDEEVEWATHLDYMFDKYFPCSLGFLMRSSIESSNLVVEERKYKKQADVFDVDKEWQIRSRRLFDEVELGPEWRRIDVVDPTRNIEREFKVIQQTVDSYLKSSAEGRIVGDRQV